MAKWEDVYETEFTHQDVFKMKDLYAFMFKWLEDNGFGKEKEIEKYYNEKHLAGGMREYRIWWSAPKMNLEKTKHHDKSKQGWIHSKIDINFLVLAMVDVELIKDGKKYKAQKGEITLNIKGSKMIDTSAWETDNIVKNWFNWYKLKGLQPKIDYHEDWIDGKTRAFAEAVKAYLRVVPHNKDAVNWHGQTPR